MSSTNRVRLSAVREIVRGTTPATPAFQDLRWVSESLGYNIENQQSDQITADRSKGPLVQVGYDVAGDIAFEFSSRSFDMLLEGAFCAAMTGTTTRTLVNGTTVFYHTIQKEYLDLSNIRQRFLGCVVNQMDLTIKKRSKITGSFSILGMNYADTAVAGATLVPQLTTQVMNASTHVTSIQMNSVPMTTCIDMINLKINNNMRPTTCVGSDGVSEYVPGDFDVSGGMDLYFNDLATFNLYRSGTPFSLLISLEDDAGNDVSFELANVQFETLRVVAGGANQDVMAVGTFKASKGAPVHILRYISTPV